MGLCGSETLSALSPAAIAPPVATSSDDASDPALLEVTVVIGAGVSGRRRLLLLIGVESSELILFDLA